MVVAPFKGFPHRGMNLGEAEEAPTTMQKDR